MKTVVGMYKTVDEANKVKLALQSEGYSGGDLTVIDQSEAGYRGGVNDAEVADDTVGGKIKNFFSGLAGHDDDTHRSYTEGIAGGGALVALRVSDDQVGQAVRVLEEHGAQQVQGGEASTYGTGTGSYGTGSVRGEEGEFGRGPVRDYDIADTHELSTGTTAGLGTTAGVAGDRSTVTGEQVIPVVAEELVVGKRQVDRGGVRVYSHVVSENVSEDVNLHNERVIVDRRTVDRPATEADFVNAGPIEVRAMGEEAVVGKTGRVVEEVVVGKTATDRTETVEDSVRHTEVDVEPVETTVGSATTTSSKY